MNRTERILWTWASLRRVFHRLRHDHGIWFILLTCIPALVILYRLLQILASRVAYPLALEWCEEGQLLQAYRVLHGMDLYVKPNQGFMPDSYPPGYFVVLAAVGAVFGLDYWVARTTSCLAMGLVMVLLGREVYRQFRPAGFPMVWAILAVGLMAAAFPISGGWFDLARNDSVVFAMVVGSAVLVYGREEMSRPRFWGAAVLMTFSMFVKQTAIFFVAWILLFELFRHPRRTLLLGLAIAGLGLLGMGGLILSSEGRYLYYTFTVFKNQQIHTDRYLQGLRAWLSFAPYLPILPVIVASSLWFNLASLRSLFWSGMLAVAFPASLLPYAKQGGFDNNLMPVALLAGPTALLLLGPLLSRFPRHSAASKVLMIGCASAAAFYLDARTFSTSGYAIKGDRWSAARLLRQEYERLGKDLLDLHHPFFAIKAGARTDQLHEMPWADAWLASIPDLTLRPFLSETNAKYLVTSGEEIPLVFDAIADFYELDRAFPPEMQARPVTGFPSWPRYLLRRRQVPKTRSCLFQFESADYKGWEKTGEAFTRPTGRWLTDRKTAIGIEGHGMVSSAPSREEGPTGVLTSPPFELRERRLSLMVGGSDHDKVKVELVVEDEPVYVARGQGVDALARVMWDTEDYIGKTARVRITDADADGHILVDSICEEP